MQPGSFFLYTLTVLAQLASASADPPTNVVTVRQSVVRPLPCRAVNPPPTAAQTELRFNTFANEFLVKKNLTAAFEFISSTYINHNPFAANGPNAALDFLGPVWNSTRITVLQTAYIHPQGFLNYNASGIGTIVDRFRWDAGCIVEHWDQGEIFPSNVTGTNMTVPASGTASITPNVTTTPMTSGALRRRVVLWKK